MALYPRDDLRHLLRLLARTGGLLAGHQMSDGTRVTASEVFALGELTDPGSASESRSDTEPLSQQDLADRLGLEKSTVSRLAAGLERRGWLRRERDPTNRRFYRLQVTADGREAACEIGAALQDQHDRLFAALTPDERDGLAKGITGLTRALETRPPVP